MTSPTTLPTDTTRQWPRWQRALVWLLVATALAAVFMLYTQPEFMVRMADHVWGCF